LIVLAPGYKLNNFIEPAFSACRQPGGDWRNHGCWRRQRDLKIATVSRIWVVKMKKWWLISVIFFLINRSRSWRLALKRSVFKASLEKLKYWEVNGRKFYNLQAQKNLRAYKHEYFCWMTGHFTILENLISLKPH
jgi:hypothetical protein